jgi:hypothetical protein
MRIADLIDFKKCNNDIRKRKFMDGIEYSNKNSEFDLCIKFVVDYVILGPN